MIGAPGNVSPVASSVAGWPVTLKRARYHTVGTRSVRCMSLATSAAPVAVYRPGPAQLLLPGDARHNGLTALSLDGTCPRTFSSWGVGMRMGGACGTSPAEFG